VPFAITSDSASQLSCVYGYSISATDMLRSVPAVLTLRSVGDMPIAAASCGTTKVLNTAVEE